MKVILFGGSFDPPHIGHKEIIKECSRYKFDKLILMPSYKSPLKDKTLITSADHRLRMLNLLVHDLNLPIDINPWEINQNRDSYTYLTINYLKKKYPKSSIFLVIGSDQLQQFSNWRNYKFILENVHIICFRRQYDQFKSFKGMSITWNKDFNIDISSSLIRQKINKGEDIENQLSPEILEYIKDNNLYGALNDI